MQNVTQLAVEFEADMSTVGGAAGLTSVLNPSNYALTRNGVDYSGHIAGISYSYNPSTRFPEALLTFDAPLPDGNYVLTVHDFILTAAGPALDGNSDGLAGGDFTRSFIINLPVPVGGELHVNTYTTGNQRNSGDGHGCRRRLCRGLAKHPAGRQRRRHLRPALQRRRHSGGR